MVATIKAITTRYHGYRFRSRLEAQWACFFDALGIRWEYEKEGFDLGAAGTYLPDFWLPQVRMWAEVKPDTFTEIERAKSRSLAQQTGYPCLLLTGLPEAIAYEAEESGEIPPGQYSTYVLTNYHGYICSEGRFYGNPGGYEVFPDTEAAAAAARSARFEHGEEGAR